MGSLVLRAALALDSGLRQRIHSAVFICPPSAGAVVLYRRIFTGYDSAFDANVFFLTRWILGNSRDGFVGNLSGMPGACSLLPSEYYPRFHTACWHPYLQDNAHAGMYAHGTSPPDLFDFVRFAAFERDLRNRLLDIAGDHALIGDPANGAKFLPKLHVISGTGRPTDTSVAIDESQVTPNSTSAGDDTVPVVSAQAFRLPITRMHVVSDIEHGTACLNQRVQEFVAEALR